MKKLITICLFAFAVTAHAWQPSGTVQLVVANPPGGSVDVLGRIVAEGFRTRGITNIAVVNRPGANGTIGTKYVLEAKPDGNTLLLTPTAFMLNRLLNAPGADYDVTKSISHVGLIGTVPIHVYARQGLANLTFKELIETVKQGKQYSWGTHAGTEFTAQLLESRLGKKLTIVPYKGSAPAIADLAGGHVDLVIDAGSSAMAHAAADSKRIKLMAVLEPKNDGIDTVDAVVSGVVTHSWFGLSLPKGANIDVVTYYNKLLNEVLNDPVVREKLIKLHVNIQPGTPQAFVNFIENEYQRYLKIADTSKK
jgi:tripartite-type tricarboxylate transporter receptor subunit TctC